MTGNFPESRLNSFKKYLAIDAMLAIYLGMWNAIVPVFIAKHYDAGALATYEIALACVAAFATLVLAPVLERCPRSRALIGGCLLIAIPGLLRQPILATRDPLLLLTLVDAGAVCGFAIVQPLLAIYPSEVLEPPKAERGFRQKRIALTVARVAGPLMAAALMMYVPGTRTLLIAVSMTIFVTWLACRLPVSRSNPRITSVNKTGLCDLLLGIRLKATLPPERFFSVNDFLLLLISAAAVPLLIPGLIAANQLPSGSAGLINTAYFSGSAIGIGLLSPCVSKLRGKRSPFVLLWVATSLCFAAIPWLASVPALMIVLALAGASSASLSFIGIHHRVASLPAGTRVRTASATLVAGQFASMMSFALNGRLLIHDGPKDYAALCGVVLCVMMIYTWIESSAWHLLKENEPENYYRKVRAPVP